jgi:branched-subunit amino acid transport protein
MESKRVIDLKDYGKKFLSYVLFSALCAPIFQSVSYVTDKELLSLKSWFIIPAILIAIRVVTDAMEWVLRKEESAFWTGLGVFTFCSLAALLMMGVLFFYVIETKEEFDLSMMMLVASVVTTSLVSATNKLTRGTK